MNEKIRAAHLARAAIVYVRQSSPDQVRNNLESQRMQYAMKTRLGELGWGAGDIQVIDDDLGVTANGTAERRGFEQLIGRVACGQVGLVAAREVSRLSRNSGDWQRLVEYCRQNDTLVMDHETVYDVRVPNDRLLLGIKGNISSYELDMIRARALDTMREKAGRGDLVIAVPAGYVKTRDQRIEMTPDRRVREAVALVFSKFLELGSAWRVTHWFREAGLALPSACNARDGSEVRWKPVGLNRVLNILKHPMYAGIYSYGRTRKEKGRRPNRSQPTVTVLRDPKDWHSVHYDHHEGYIDAATFERIRSMLKNNTQKFAGQRGAGGAARNGHGLLSGLLRCARCGRLLQVIYQARRNEPKYVCFHSDGASPGCRFYFAGRAPDEIISRAVLQVLSPLTVETAERAFLEHDATEDDREKALSRECERARYEAERAFRQYDAIDPENRLVAATLEKRWNRALEQQRDAEERLAEMRAVVKRDKHSREDFLALAAAFPDIWNDPATDITLKKRIVRTLIEEVATEEISKTEIVLRVHWRGGNHTEHHFRRRRIGENTRQHSPEAVDAIKRLHALCGDGLIAKYLSQNRIPRARGGTDWTSAHVAHARRKRGLPGYDKDERRRQGFMTLREAASFLKISPDGLQALAERGEVPHDHPLPVGPYIFRRADLEGQDGDRLRALVRSRLKRKAVKTAIPGRLFDRLMVEGNQPGEDATTDNGARYSGKPYYGRLKRFLAGQDGDRNQRTENEG